jgi:hypothetical protein
VFWPRLYAKGNSHKKAQKSQNSFRLLVFLVLFCGYSPSNAHFDGTVRLRRFALPKANYASIISRKI